MDRPHHTRADSFRRSHELLVVARRVLGTARELATATLSFLMAKASDQQVPVHRYGRGKFEPHPNRIAYMEMIVEHPNYKGMPGARSHDGRINWQVSSGKTTSFYKDYLGRVKWWTEKADSLGLPGQGKENSRWTVAARRIHPTGYRPCLLCGNDRNVGYFYLNANSARRLNKLVEQPVFEKYMAITDAIDLLRTAGEGHLLGSDSADNVIRRLFPERAPFFDKYGVTQQTFERFNYVATAWLTPGFMGDPPYRFDGLHDYCNLGCRSKNDPGRSDDNMRSYQRDRRAFQWWAEGDWQMADDLYNSAGPGKCAICGVDVDRVSPDHVGPLACGFKQLPLFVPTCKSCNSSKNRRMRASDVRALIAYEKRSGESAASWHVRGMWDTYKSLVRTDEEAAELSAHMRAVQDCYLRCLYALANAGKARFLRTLLAPEFAYYDHEFEGLDKSKLTFTKVNKTENRTSYRDSLARRSVRIAFAELAMYVMKEVARRRIRMGYAEPCEAIVARVLEHAKSVGTVSLDYEWDTAIRADVIDEKREAMIEKLIWKEDATTLDRDKKLRAVMQSEFDGLAEVARSAFPR